MNNAKNNDYFYIIMTKLYSFVHLFTTFLRIYGIKMANILRLGIKIS